MISALFALAVNNTKELFIYLAYFPFIAFWILDGYFLHQEKLFRKLYNHVRGLDEIQKSIDEGKGLLGIDISKIKDLQKKTTERCGKIPKGYNFYLWNNDKGNENMGDWIEKAARDAGR